LKPDFTSTPATPEIGFIHRHLKNGDLYFVANTCNRAQRVEAGFRDAAAHAEMWDPFTGKTLGLTDPKQIKLDLKPYESRIIFFSSEPLSPAGPQPRMKSSITDLSPDWTVSFEGESQPVEMHTLASWPDEPRLRYYSGRATYRKTITIDAADTQP